MRRNVLAVFLALSVAVAGYSAYWFILADDLRDGVGSWAERQRAQGYTLRWESLVVEGYPGVFRLRFGQAKAIGNLRLPVEIVAPELSGEARPWNLQRWHVHASQGIDIEAPGDGGGLKAATLDGWVEIGGETGTAVDFAARRLTGTGSAAGFGAAPFGATIETVSLGLTIKGDLPQGRLRDALALWQRRGGTVELAGASLRWGALAIDASGTLALDEGLQPVGALAATIESDDAVIDEVTALGKLRPGDVALIKSVARLMAKSGPDGKQRLTLPVTLKNDRVYLGPAQIAALPRFTWE
jgi:hypothetical protein